MIVTGLLALIDRCFVRKKGSASDREPQREAVNSAPAARHGAPYCRSDYDQPRLNTDWASDVPVLWVALFTS